MKTNKRHIFKGYWKLPTDENYRISGELNFDPVQGGVLEIMGSFGSQDERTLEEKHKIINGFTPDGIRLTLLDCHGFGNTSIPGIPTQKIYIKTILVSNIYLEDINELFFEGASCHFLGLDEWVEIDGFNRGNEPQDLYKVVYVQPNEITLWNAADEEIFIWFRTKGPSIRFFSKIRSIKQTTLFGLKYEIQKDFAQILDRILMLKNFISFALSERTLTSEITLIKKDLKGKTRYFKVLSATNEYNFKGLDFSNSHTMLFCFRDVRENYVDIFKSWFRLYEKLRPVLELYFQSINNVYLGSENYFLNLMFAIETYHRRTNSESKFNQSDYDAISNALQSTIKNLNNKKYTEWLDGVLKYGNELSLRKRLDSILRKTHPRLLELIGDTEKFISKVLNTRNFLVHYDASLEKNVIKPDQFFSFNLKLKILLQICILQELGFNEKQIGEFVVRTPTFWNA
ncbi:MAG: HEPN domain-containing protein [Bacteroidota bacterium]